MASTFMSEQELLQIDAQASFHDPGASAMDIWAASGGLHGQLGKISKLKKIAVIGAGISGLTVSMFLQRSGAHVSLFEAEDQVGGRMRCSGSDGKSYPDGPMRFTKTSAMTLSLMRQFNCGMKQGFPNPGCVDTACDFRNQVHDWKSGDEAPRVFAKQRRAFEAFLTENITFRGKIVLVSIENIRIMLSSDSFDDRKQAADCIQEWVDRFCNRDFYQLLLEIFDSDLDPPGGIKLSSAEIQLMAETGIGTGPFDQIMKMDAVQLLSILINGHEQGQGSFVTVDSGYTEDAPMEEFVQRFSSHIEKQGTVIRCGSHVDAIRRVRHRHGLSYRLAWVNRSGRRLSSRFHQVIFCVPAHALLHRIQGLPKLLGKQLVRDLGQVNAMPCTKVFVTIKNIFADFPDFYRCITSDKDFKQMYMLSQDKATCDVLLSYTWDDDALKLEKFGDDESLLRALLVQVRETIRNSSYPTAAMFFNREAILDYRIKRWHHDPVTRGGFALARVGECAARQRIMNTQRLRRDRLRIVGADLTLEAGWIEPALKMAVQIAVELVEGCGELASEVKKVANFGQHCVSFPQGKFSR